MEKILDDYTAGLNPDGKLFEHVQQIQSAKQQLESAIAKLLRAFNNNTGLSIERIDVTGLDRIDGKVVGYIVEVEPKL